MAKIPLYQQERLASSRVGVPELNTSGLSTAKSFLGNTEALANTQTAATGRLVNEQAAGMDQGVSEASVLLFHKQAQLSLAATAMTELQNKSAISALSVPINYTLSDLENEAKTKNAGNPKDAAKYFQDNATQRINDAVNQMGLENRPQVAQGVLAHANEKLSSHYESLVSYGFSQGNTVEEDRTVASAKQAIQRAGVGTALDPKTIGDAFQNINQLSEAIKTNSRTAGEAETKQAQYKQDALIGWITNGINQDPKKALGVLEAAKDNFNGLVPSPVMGSLKSKAQEAIAHQETMLEKQQAHDAIGVNHQIIDIKDQSNVDLYLNADKAQLNPEYLSKSQDALVKLRTLYGKITAQPETKANDSALKALDAAINTQQTQVKEYMTAVAAKASGEAKEHKAQLAEQKKAAIAHYDSQAGVAARTAVDEAFDKVKGINKIKNLKENLTDAQLFDRLQTATQVMKKAHDDGYLTKPGQGQDDKYYSSQSAYLNAANDRLVQKAAKPNFWEDHGFALTDGPPALVMNAKNPDNDPKITQQVNHEYSDTMHQGVDHWKDSHGGKLPSKDQIVKYIRPNAIRLYLGLPIPRDQ